MNLYIAFKRYNRKQLVFKTLNIFKDFFYFPNSCFTNGVIPKSGSYIPQAIYFHTKESASRNPIYIFLKPCW